MTYRDRMLAAITHQSSDEIPWAPRMDLWYIANRASGTLEDRFKNMNTVEIARELGVACHAVRGDYTLNRPKEDLILRGFGLDNHPDYPFRFELRKFPVDFITEGDNIKTTITTPAGELHTHIKISQDMLKDGISLPFILSYPIRTRDDIEAVAQVFENIEIVPTPDNYKSFKNRIGDQGLAIANALPVASPIHLMLHDLMPMDQFFYMYMDYREELHDLARRMEPFFDKVLDAVLASDCEVFLWGSNYDQNTTYPPFFEEEILPWLQKASARARKAGKYLLSHTDGENKELLRLYRDSGIAVAESVCPAPMTKCTLKEVREGMGNGITVFGGIPAVALIEGSMNEAEFEHYLDVLFSELGTGEGLILGVSDNVPPKASLPRMEKIRLRIKEFGPVRPGSETR